MNTKERLQEHLSKKPQVDPTAWVAKSADVMGDVKIGPKAAILYQVVVRGDIEKIDIGEGTNIQDGAVIHMADDLPVIIGDYVTVGHKAIVHACTIEDECLIGMNSTILDGSVIGRRSIIAAGAVVPPGTIVPPGSMVRGIPGKITPLSEERQLSLRHWAEKYIEVAAEHRKRFGEKDFSAT
jgi:carbonic anhydrase/acetyltransferase-like protein (isoleucine patch superfamily)|tara:strand:+ start:41 stop:586 length:546 start_codon:yes stop_codon:yes gene_type:complete